MKVEHIHALSFTVTSQSDPAVSYAVDLKGKPDEMCTCDDFWHRHGPAIRKGGSPKDNHCKHIKAAIDHLVWEMVVQAPL